MLTNVSDWGCVWGREGEGEREKPGEMVRKGREKLGKDTWRSEIERERGRGKDVCGCALRHYTCLCLCFREREWDRKWNRETGPHQIINQQSLSCMTVSQTTLLPLQTHKYTTCTLHTGIQNSDTLTYTHTYTHLPVYLVHLPIELNECSLIQQSCNKFPFTIVVISFSSCWHSLKEVAIQLYNHFGGCCLWCC